MRNSREGVKTVNETLTRAFSTHSFKETPHLECVAVSCNQHSSADFLSGLKGLGATPQRAGIEPFGIAMEHRAEEVRAPRYATATVHRRRRGIAESRRSSG